MHCDQPRARDPAAASGPCPSLAGPCVMRSSRRSPQVLGNGVEFDLLTDKLAELLGRLRGLQAAIEVDRRLDTAMSKQPPYGLVVAGMVLQINCRRSVPELVRRDAKSYRFLDTRNNLCTECDCVLRLT